MILDSDFLKQLEQLQLACRQMAGRSGDGPHLSKRHGASHEFSGHASYSLGDDYRMIDWNVYSRLDQLVVKQFSSQESQLVHIVLDSSASMACDQVKWIHALQLTAAMAYVTLNTSNHVRIWIASAGKVQVDRLFRSKEQVKELLQFLESVKPAGKTDLASSLGSVGSRISSPGLVMVVSDFFDESPVKELLQALRAKYFDVSVLQVLSDADWHPVFDGASVAVDCESGDTMQFEFDEHARGQYVKALVSLQDKWQAYCNRHEMRFHVMRRHETMIESVLRYMFQRGA